MNWIVARLLCEDGTTIEVAGNAFKVKGTIADAAISAVPLSEGFCSCPREFEWFSTLLVGDVRWMT